MRLIICEKPSVAQSIARALGVREKKNGYLEGGDQLISWCIGHLAGLAEAEAYRESFGRWNLSDLPILPEAWQFSVHGDKREQFDLLCDLLRRPDVTEVVNACDAGREGELIFRTVYELARCDKPMLRLWVSSMEDGAIQEGFRQLRNGHDYDGLYAAALCRAKADWLVGINATRLFSIYYHRTLNIGRVVSPTLALLVEREAEIARFQPTTYYTTHLDCGDWSASSEQRKEKTSAESLTGETATAVVRSVERQEKKENPPALFDLTTIQREANRTLGYTAQQTLDYLQALYEKKLVSYPRTDSRFLTDDMEPLVPEMVSIAAALCREKPPASMFPLGICDSKKVSDHHALIPTRLATRDSMETLPIGERMILRLVAIGLLRAVSPPFRYAETTVTLDWQGETFTTRGKQILDMGWRAYADSEVEECILPELMEGDSVPIHSVTVKTGKTAPPKHMTEDTLLSGMENVGGKEGERRGIGTPATRAAILEKLVASGFAERKKAQKLVYLLPTHTGTSLITVLPEHLQSPLLTAEWEHRLKEIEKGELSPEAFLEETSAMLQDLVRDYRVMEGADVLFPSNRTVVGKCPRCGRDVTESKRGFFCEGHDCRFALWKDSRFFAAKRKELTREIVTELLKGKQVRLRGCWSEKTGKSYDCVIGMEDNGERAQFQMLFDHG